MNDEPLFVGHGVVILRRAGSLFVRYDGGALVPTWLEAPISAVEADALKAGAQSAYQVLLGLDARSAPMAASR